MFIPAIVLGLALQAPSQGLEVNLGMPNFEVSFQAFRASFESEAQLADFVAAVERAIQGLSIEECGHSITSSDLRSFIAVSSLSDERGGIQLYFKTGTIMVGGVALNSAEALALRDQLEVYRAQNNLRSERNASAHPGIH